MKSRAILTRKKNCDKPHAWKLNLCAAALLLATGLAGCIGAGQRSAVPLALASAATIEGVKLARIWGDEVGGDIRAVVSLQYSQADQAIRSGKRAADSRLRADFLAISGGGADGAYAAGFLKGWSWRGDRPTFEVVTGVSTGALAAPFAFLGARYDRALEEIFTRYGDSDIYINQGLIALMGRSVYDNSPLRRLIAHYMTEALLQEIAEQYHVGRRLLIQTTNIDAQRPVIWDLTAIAASNRPNRRESIVDILLASAAIPAIFPPVRINVMAKDEVHQELHVDGATVSQVFFAPPNLHLVDFERRFFGKARGHTLYLIRNGRLHPEYGRTEETTLGIARRSIETLVKYQAVADLVRLEKQAEVDNGRVRFTAIPAGFAETPKSEFDRHYMRQLFEIGVNEGLAGRWRSRPPKTPVVSQRDG